MMRKTGLSSSYTATDRKKLAMLMRRNEKGARVDVVAEERDRLRGRQF